MSGNNGPIYIGKDGAIYNSWEERDQADARNKQHEKQLNELQNLRAEQERSNQLAQQMIYEERANAERIAQATVQAEKEKALYQAILQQQQHTFEEEQRKIRLCDDLGVDYEEIKIFEDYLSNGDNEISEKIDSLNKAIECKEKLLEECRNNRPDSKSIIEKYDNEIKELQLNIPGVKEEVKGTWFFQFIWDSCILTFGIAIVGGLATMYEEERISYNTISTYDIHNRKYRI